MLWRRRPAHRGYAILGANELGHALGGILRAAGEEVVFLDSNPAACKIVEQDGFKVIYGSAIEERTLQRAQLDERAACVAVTPNSEVNLTAPVHSGQPFKTGDEVTFTVFEGHRAEARERLEQQGWEAVGATAQASEVLSPGAP